MSQFQTKSRARYDSLSWQFVFSVKGNISDTSYCVEYLAGSRRRDIILRHSANERINAINKTAGRDDAHSRPSMGDRNLSMNIQSNGW